MKIQFVSDLHLEFADNRTFLEAHPLEVTGDILLVAGDTAYLDVPDSGRNTYSQYEFWNWASQNYRQVIVCLGNHDFYGYYDLATMPDGYCKQIRHNVHAYYNKVVSIDDIDIIVSTLWSFIEPFDAYHTEKGVSDFYRIIYNGHRLMADDFNNEHERCFDFIRKAVKESKARTKIVLTHHVPSPLVMSDEFRGSRINGAFVADLTDYIKHSDIDYWIFGHSHRTLCDLIGHTQVLSNQLGYVARDEHLHGFDAGKFIEIG